MRNRSGISAEPDLTQTESGTTALSVPSNADDAPREKNPAAAALGRIGGKKGGRARAERLSPEERRASARKAAAMRWAKAPITLVQGVIASPEPEPSDTGTVPPSPFAKHKGE